MTGLHKTLVAFAAALTLAGCANTDSGVYTREQAMREMTVRYGIVEAVRPVTLEGTKSGVGAVAGGAIGGIAGSHIGQGTGSYVGAIVGAVAGAVAGSALEKEATKEEGQEITVKLEGGRLISIVQGGQEQFRVGDRVRVLSGNGETRVTY